MSSYRYSLRLTTSDKSRAFFGPGPAGLFEKIERTRSISKAAKEMNMAYTKAWRIIKYAEDQLNCSLVETMSGGKGGGGSSLTAKAKKLLSAYLAMRSELDDKTKELYEKHIAPILDK
jgi:molybdate transport system regulatory protein